MDALYRNIFVSPSWDLDQKTVKNLEVVLQQEVQEKALACFLCLKEAFNRSPTEIKNYLSNQKELSCQKVHQVAISLLIDKQKSIKEIANDILYVMNQVPRQCRKPNLIEVLKAFFKGICFEWERKVLRNFLLNFSLDGIEKNSLLEKRVALIEKAVPFIPVESSDLWLKFDVLKLVYLVTGIKTPLFDNEKEVINKTLFFFQKNMGRKGRLKILKSISEIAPQERAEVLHHAYLFFEESISSSLIVFILQAINKINSNRREEIVKAILQLTKGIKDQWEKLAILRSVVSIKDDNKLNVIERAKPLLKGVTNGWQKSHILWAVNKIDPEHQQKVIEKTLSFVQDESDIKKKINFLLVVKETMVNEEEGLLEKIQKKCKEKNIVETEKKMTFLQLLLLVSQRDDQTFEKIENFVQQVTNKVFVGNILTLLNYIAPQYRLKLIYLFTHNPSVNSWAKELQRLFQNLEIRRSSHNYLIHLLQTSKDKEKVCSLAETIIRNQKAFFVYDEHPLLLEAIHVKILFTSSKNLKNPYVVYEKLQKLWNKPPSLTPSYIHLNGKEVRLNIEQIKKTTKQEKICVKDLPKEVNRNSLKQLKNCLYEKIILKRKVFKQKLQEIENKLKNTCDEQLKEKFKKEKEFLYKEFGVGEFPDVKSIRNFFESEFLESLLAVTSNSDVAKVPITAAQFFAIVHYLKELPDIYEETYLLTDQGKIRIRETLSLKEKTALMMISSIQNCAAGQSEGIAFTYHLLPDEYKIKLFKNGFLEKSQEEIRAITLIRQVIKNLLNSMFLGESQFLKKVIKAKVINQGVHQSIYLKNLIGKWVGLDHQLTFDRHTNTLYNSLIQKERDELINIFYSCFTPQLVIDGIFKRIKTEMEKERTTVYVDIEFLLKSTIKCYTSGSAWCEEKGNYFLSKSAIRDLLIALNFLEERQVQKIETSTSTSTSISLQT